VTEPEPVDFAKVIAELEAAGLSLYKISVLMHRQYVQVQRWSKGVAPKHYEGQMLLMIHGSTVSRETLQSELSGSDNIKTPA
jgi:hypothetical protein